MSFADLEQMPNHFHPRTWGESVAFLEGLQDVLELIIARQVAERLEGLEGDIRSLLQEDGPVREGIENFSEATASLNRTLQRLESRDNLMGRMLSDEEYAEKVSQDLEILVHNLAEISEKPLAALAIPL